MKINEIMIGDWVNVLPISHKVKAHYDKVESIRKEYTGQLYVEGGYHNREHIGEDWFDWSVGIDNIAPIPLTPEIFEKNGFERCATAPSFWLVGNLYYGTLLGISEDSYEDTWHVSTFKDHNDNDWVLFKVCYVHELQHILKLLDIDKEIKL